MVNISTILEMLFKRVEPQDVLNGKITYSALDKDIFILLGRSYCQQYSNLELENMYDYFCGEIAVQEVCSQDRKKSGGKTLNVFEILFKFAETVLLEEREEPVISYMYLLRWRMLSHMLEENLFTTAFLAYKDLKRRSCIREFGWKTVIGNNNVYLKQILNQGLSENHFHLKGSAPYFQLSWIAMMNHISRVQYRETLIKYDKQRLSSNIHYSGHSKSEPLYVMHRQAALIRALLYAKLTGKIFHVHEYYIPSNQIREWLDDNRVKQCFNNGPFLDKKDIKKSCHYLYEHFKTLELSEIYCSCYPEKVKNDVLIQKVLELFHGRKFALEFFERFYGDQIYFMEFFDSVMSDVRGVLLEHVKPFIERKRYLELMERITLKSVKGMLCISDDIELNLTSIQSWIDCEKNEYSFTHDDQCVDDYVLIAPYEKGDCSNEYHQILSGERWLMYEMFKHIYAKTPGYKEYNNLFYAYLLIKEIIRAEMVQVNSNIGFDNFSRYELRKEDFIEGTEYERYYTELALKEPMRTQAMVSLEARISPRNSAEENFKYLNKQDKNSGLSREELDKVYYVMHFVKRPDKKLNSGGIYGEINCRHELLRREIKEKALALVAFRERFPEKANRFLGIDACNEEITCRPEVFAQAFRFLRNHSFIEKRQDCFRGINLERRLKLPELGITYHVGEDFLDVVDGLRAVEEAVRFLNMKCGDRIGHGLVLGIDTEEWYQLKNYRILISQQDYLDNVVWLYMKIKLYGLENCQETLLHLEEEYNKYFRMIYGKNIQAEGYKIDSSMLQGILVYYESWKLRGDCPDCYFSGKYKPKSVYGYSWDDYAVSSSNSEWEDDVLRYKAEAAFLYYCYHYNKAVKKEGSQKREIKIPSSMLSVISKVQSHLLNEVAVKGIAIEANPSSNYLISTIKAYDQHPITRFYQIGLCSIHEKEEKCPQIPVSINTDDQGVFGTCLENEYALMALALERMKDKDGNRSYTRAEVQNWLDNIRKIGIQYSFLKRQV